MGKPPIDLEVSPAPTIMAFGIAGGGRSQYYIVDEPEGERMRKTVRRYRVPSMKEVAGIRGTNGLKMVSTFSGCGGSCLGFEMAGFAVLWASEFVEAARKVYVANHPDTILDSRDIREVDADDILAACGLRPGELDVFEGSPPCASFSMAGKREKSWGDVKKYSDVTQRTDDLFFEYVRLLDGLRPKTFVAENVSGLVKGSAKGYFKMILACLRECGYVVKASVLDASLLGVPQKRERLIFFGVREDLGVAPRFPKPRLPVISVREALIGAKPGKDDPIPSTFKKGGMMRRLYDMTNPGEGFDSGSKRIRGTSGCFQFRRNSFNKPSMTIVQGSQSACHPTEPRSFAIHELKRICAFPDDFVLFGSYAKQWERLGRAVPPLMMRAIAEEVQSVLEEAGDVRVRGGGGKVRPFGSKKVCRKRKGWRRNG